MQAIMEGGKQMLHHVKNLSPEQRHAAEILLGHPVSENETLSIKSLASSTIIPSLRPTRPAYELPPEEWMRQFKAWMQSHAGNTVVLSDEAMERESIYGDHGR
jgi:hypothetical protein